MQRFESGPEVPSPDLSGSTVLFRCGARRARYLLIINKGPGAVQIPREGDAWDLMEIYFAKKDIEAITAYPAITNADWVVFEHDRNMRKFAIIKRVIGTMPDLLGYEAIMMLDDDLVPVGCNVSDIFALFAETGLRIGQPALSEDSFWSHEVVLRNASFRWRRTNFVEVMCPIMTTAALQDYLPLFDETVSAFGLDVYWSREEWKYHTGVAILDATPMRHIRPVRGGVAYQGLSPGTERYLFFRRHKLKNFKHYTLGGASIDGGPLLSSKMIRYRSQLSDLVKFRLLSMCQSMRFLAYCLVAVFWNQVAKSPVRGHGHAAAASKSGDSAKL